MQYPWKPHYSHPVAIQNERCFPFWTILADAQPKNAQRLRRFPLFLRPILNHGVRRRPQDLWTSWQSSHQVFTEWLILFKLCYVNCMWHVDLQLDRLGLQSVRFLMFFDSTGSTTRHLFLQAGSPSSTFLPKTAEGVENLRKRIVKMKVGSFEDLSNSKLLILIFAWSLQWLVFFFL